MLLRKNLRSQSAMVWKQAVCQKKENLNVSSKIETKKPLEQVNISDLLALHKKS